MKHTISQTVTIDIRLDGEDHSLTFEAGDHQLHPAVAAILVEQGIAKPAGGKATKTTTEPEPESTKE